MTPADHPKPAALAVDWLVLGACAGLFVVVLLIVGQPHAPEVGRAVLLLAALAGLSIVAVVTGLLHPGQALVASVAVLGLALVVSTGVAIDQGAAIFFVGLLAAVGSLSEYRRRLDDRRLAVAVAIEAEINTKSTFARRQLTPAVFDTMIKRTREEDFKPFTFQLDRFFPAYLSHQGELGLLPPETVQLIVEFYDIEESLTRLYNGIGSAAFHGLSKERRITLYREFERTVMEDYAQATDNVLAALAALKGR